MASSRSHLPLPLPLNSSAVAIAGGVMINANQNSNPNLSAKVKQTKGRRKIPIKKIENKNKKHVTFSKRRKGLFTKASELYVLCGASVAVITFSEAGKVFLFGHPSPDAVLHRYLHGNPAAASSSSSPPAPVNSFDSLSNHHTSIVSAAAAAAAERQFWWERPVEELGFEEVEAFAAALGLLRSNVDRKIAELDYDRAIVPVKTEGIDNQHHHLMMMQEGMTDYLSLPLPPPAVDHQQNQQYYQPCGCGCTEVGDEGIGRIVSMAEFNRFGRFGEY